MKKLTFTSPRAFNEIVGAAKEVGLSGRLAALAKRTKGGSVPQPYSKVWGERIYQEIFESGKFYKPVYIKNQAKALVAEVRGMETLERAGYQGLDCRLQGNKGFDGVFIKYGANQEVLDIIILESKFSKTGRARLGKTKKYGTQMSDKWITRQIELMEAQPHLKETAELLGDNKHLIRGKVNVLDANGQNRWNIIKLME